MSYFTTVLIIGFLIFVHEWGHLVAARWAKIPVARFSIGFGPVLWSWRRAGVEYCTSLIPLGGYVMPKIDSEEDFFRIAPGRRIVMWLGGPVANLLLAGVGLMTCNLIAGPVSLWGFFVEPWIQVVAGSLRIVMVLPTLFLHPEGLSGIIGIVATGKTFVTSGALASVRFGVLLSLNLAVFNLLPVAPLDGGKIVCCLLEKVHPRLASLHTRFAVIGIALLLTLVAYTTVMDVVRQLA